MSRRGAILQDYGGTFPEQSHDAEKAAANYYQRDKEQANELRYKKQVEKQKEGKDATDFITGLKADHVGDNTVDLYNDAEILKLQNELTDMQMKGASVQDIKITAMQKLPKIAQGYTVAKSGFEKIKSGLTDLSKDYPSGNTEAARNLAGKELIKDIFEYDENGKIKGYKDPSLLPKDKDYVKPLTSPDKLEQWYTPSGGLTKNIQALPLTKIGESKKVRDKKGVERDNNWEGQGSVFSRLKTDENGATVGQEIKSEQEPIGKNPDGSIMYANVLPKDEFALMVQTPTAKADFQLMFRKHLKDINIDPSKLDPRAEDVLQRQFAKDWLEQTNVDGSSFITKEAVKQPLPPRISVKVNTAKAEPPVIDVFTTIDEKASAPHPDKNIGGKIVENALQANLLDDNEQAVVLEKARKASAGNANIGVDDIYLKKLPDGIWIFRAEDNVPLTKITPTGTNVTANKPEGQKSVNKATAIAQSKEQKNKPQLQSRKGKDGKEYTSTDGITWKAKDGTTVTLQK